MRRSIRVSHAAIAATTVGIDFAVLALPIFILQIYDRVLPNQTGSTLLVLVLGLAIAVSVDLCLRLIRGALASAATARLDHAMRLAAVDRLLAAPLQVFHDLSATRLAERVGAVSTLRDFEASKKIEIRVDLWFAAVYLGLIAYLGGALVLVPLVLMAAFSIVAAVLGRALHRSFEARSRADHSRQDALLKLLQGVETIKALALGRVMLRQHEPLQEESAIAVQRVMHRTALVQTVTTAFAQTNTVALLTFGAMRVIDGEMTLGAVAACTLLSSRALQPIQTAIGLWTSYQSVRIAKQDVADVLGLPAERNAVGRRFAISGRVEFVDVTYTPPGASEPLLRDVNLVLEPGCVVGIEGAPGAGKTTLLHLALGLLQPQAGRVLVDGEDVRTLALDGLRRQMTLLTRDAPVYRGTVIDNLTHFREGECVNEAMYVSFLLGADEPIRRLPAGFDHFMEAGSTVSAGLRQRLALVRGLATSPKVILFDDADHGLDHDSRTRLLALLKDLGATASVLLISPHADVLAQADRRYRLSQGRLISLGAADGRALVRAA
ncbi:ABC transporter transmembrane domain-containing protein [Lichenihabitans sp. Uapishka_5]|uniref:peptidase domain-containing ABC transporter n=1 Tax=Lichenihabitans sp. Uapishka_5 TaxID=3037302 RepID=UPI0029E7E501|nr:ABC transporter transmembrane domain-containing protein [Lichenihabitans sp. Uapishka_5]MDX7950865.1 ABC transporter transmembrane domain-containing protein [Lichenihabitans sp. Uapishka_5]